MRAFIYAVSLSLAACGGQSESSSRGNGAGADGRSFFEDAIGKLGDFSDEPSGDGDGDGFGDGDWGDGDGDTDASLGIDPYWFLRGTDNGGTGRFQPGDFDEDGSLVADKLPFLVDWNPSPLYLREVPLTNEQWARSVQAILNLDQPPSQVASLLSPVRGFTWFTNNELLGRNAAQFEALFRAADEIALEQLAEVGAFERIDAGMELEAFIAVLGRRAFRRPLSVDEIVRLIVDSDRWSELPGDASEFQKRASVVVAELLKSLSFLNRIEAAPVGARLSGYELIAKLSLWLLQTTPSDELLDRAAAGEFDTAEGLAQVTRELLADPRASEAAVDMFEQVFRIPSLASLEIRDPAWSQDLNDEAAQASRLFLRWIYEEGLGLSELLTEDRGFVGPLLAPLYGLAEAPRELVLTELGPSRVGYFSQVPNLMLTGSDADSNAPRRGGILLSNLLCAELPPPPNQGSPLLSSTQGLTTREIFVQYTEDACGVGCHRSYVNPLGFAFEHFDGLGRYRELDNDIPVDASASYPFGFGDDIMTEFDGPEELMPLITESAEAHACLARHIVGYALGRDVTQDDGELLIQLAEVSRTSGGSLQEMMFELVQTPAFHTRQHEVSEM